MHSLDDQHHSSDEDLLAFLDGEMKPGEVDETRSHLASCGECRDRVRNMEEALAGFMELRGAWADRDADSPGVDLRRFEQRLEQFAAESSPWSRIRSWLSAPGSPGAPRLAFKVACVAVLLLAGWLWLSLRQVRTVSASELLERAGSVEAESFRGVERPVIYRELTVRRSVSGADSSETAKLECWTDTQEKLSRQSGQDSLWRQLTEIFEANNMEGMAPLSVQAYLAWRESAAVAREKVTVSRWMDGDEVLALEGSTNGSGARNEILEHELVVRAADWHPIRQRLRVRGDPDPIEFELTELDFDVVPFEAVPGHVFADVREPGDLFPGSGLTPAARGEQLTAGHPVVPAVSPVEAAEAKVRYQLHLMGACRRELVYPLAEPSGRIHVRGVVETSQRRKEIVEALDALGLGHIVRIDIKSVEEAAGAEELFEALKGVELRQTVPQAKARPAPARKPAPIRELLMPYFEEQTGDVAARQVQGQQPEVEQRITRLADEAVSLAASALVEAGALRRLADRYGGEALGRLDGPSRRLVLGMARDHAESLGDKIQRNEDLLAPVLGSIAGERSPSSSARLDAGSSDWADSAHQQFALVEQLHRLVRGLFACGDLAMTQVEAVARLLEMYPAFRGGLPDLERKLARELSSEKLLSKAPAQ